MNVQAPTLDGQLVRLEPLVEAHVEPLYAIALSAPDEFRYTSTPTTEEQKERYFAKVFKDRDEGRAYPFALLEKSSGRVIGATRLTELHPQYRNAELGYTWLEPTFYGSAVNIDSKLLILGFAFETLDLIRVQLNVDSRNERSQASIHALGATYEGTLRSHQIMRDGYIRDTMVFSILQREWPELKPKLEARLERKLAGRNEWKRRGKGGGI